MTPSDIKASLATIRFALCKAAQYGVDSQAFGDELTQLGLPNEHSLAIMRVFAAQKEKLRFYSFSISFCLLLLLIFFYRVSFFKKEKCFKMIFQNFKQLLLLHGVPMQSLHVVLAEREVHLKLFHQSHQLRNSFFKWKRVMVSNFILFCFVYIFIFIMLFYFYFHIFICFYVLFFLGTIKNEVLSCSEEMTISLLYEMKKALALIENSTIAN